MSAAIGGHHLVPVPPRLRRGHKENPGIIPGQYATIVRQPGWNSGSRTMLARQRARELCERARAAHLAACRYNAARCQLEMHSCQRHMAGTARYRFSLALRAADADLNIRRQRLQDMLMCEDSQLTAELVTRKQQAPFERLQAELQAVQAHCAAKAEAERKEVERLRLIQYRDKCVELRDQKKQDADCDAKDVQLYQVHERSWLKHLQRENEQFWTEVHKKNTAAMAECEEEVARAAYARNLQQARDNLALSDAAKRGAECERLRMVEEEARFNDALDQQIVKEKMEEAEMRRAEKADLAKSLVGQREEERQKHEWAEQAERRFDLASLRFAQEELQRTTQGWRDRKEHERREARLIREFKLYERRQKLELQQQVDEAYNAVAADANRCREKRRVEYKEAVAQLERETYACRAQQLEQKRQDAMADAQAAAEERCRVEQLRREHKALEEHAQHMEKERQRRYAQELLEQQRYKQIVKEREFKLEQERLEVELHESQEQMRKAKVILENPVPQPPHPLMECLARYPPPQSVNQAPDMSAPCWPVDPCGQRDPPVSFASDAAAAAALNRGVPGVMAAAAAAAQRETAAPARVIYPSIAETCTCCGGVRYPPPTPCENCERLKRMRAAYGVGRRMVQMDVERQRPLPALAMARSARAGFVNANPALQAAVERTGMGSGVTGLPRIKGEKHAPPPAQPALPNPCVIEKHTAEVAKGLQQTLVVTKPDGGVPLCYVNRGGNVSELSCEKMEHNVSRRNVLY